MLQPLQSSPIPRYLQIADLLRKRIGRGQWRTGEQLPTLEALVAEFGVARVTVTAGAPRRRRAAGENTSVRYRPMSRYAGNPARPLVKSAMAGALSVMIVVAYATARESPCSSRRKA